MEDYKMENVKEGVNISIDNDNFLVLSKFTYNEKDFVNRMVAMKRQLEMQIDHKNKLEMRINQIEEEKTRAQNELNEIELIITNSKENIDNIEKQLYEVNKQHIIQMTDEEIGKYAQEEESVNPNIQ